jgi:pimeloyl-ACP methyl ester carboxylesterase
MSSRAIVLAVAAALCAALPSAALADPYTEGSPPGANDFSCKPTAAHPNPVVLVHGLGATMQANWYWMSPKIAAQGYCVFALTYGTTDSNPPPFNDFGGTVRMEESSLQLSAFVDRVLAATGAAKVDIVGHSEGSLMPDYYLKFVPASHYTDGALAGQPKVDRYVGMTPLWNGTNLAEAGTLSDAGEPTGVPDMVKGWIEDYGCASCTEFIQGSDFITKMNSAGGPKVPGVTYTMIMTTHDELVQPYDSGRMAGATNIVMQDQCPADPSEHVALATNPNTLLDVLNALDPAHPRGPIDCTTLLNFN